MIANQKYQTRNFLAPSIAATIADRFAAGHASPWKHAARMGLFALILTLFPPPPAQAQESWRSGWFGDIRIGGGMVSGRPSGLDVWDDDERRDRLTGEGDRVSEGFPLIGGEISYGFAQTGTMVSAGGGMEDPWHVSLGQKVDGWGLFSLRGLYEETEVWENPYRIGVDRQETDAESFGWGLEWENIRNTDLTVYFQRMEVDVDRDRIGAIEPDLRRDGADTSLGIRYPWDLGAGGVLTGGIEYTQIDRDGEANSANGYGAELNHRFEWRRWSFITGLEFVAKEFDEIHPVFNETRREATFTASETVSFAEPWGLQNTRCFAFAGYSETASDISFFERSATILGAGVGYRF
jgi:hypothetical protein